MSTLENGLRKTKSLGITKVGRLVQQMHFSAFSLHKPAPTSQDLQVQPRDRPSFQSQFQMLRRLASVEADIQNNHVARITIYLTDRLAHGICLIP